MSSTVLLSMATINTTSTIRDEQPKKREEEEEEETTEKPNCHPKKMKLLNRGAWTAEEDRKLAEVIEIYGPKRWKSIAAKAGLDRCGKSCRLRWMNYLRPNIKRGNISDQEEDLILRLHKLLGNRWSLIAGRLPGRTDNEIKNYWNSHLSKKVKQGEERPRTRNSSRKTDLKTQSRRRVFGGEVKRRNDTENTEETEVSNKSKDQEEVSKGSSSFDDESQMNFNVDDFFDFSNENPSNLEWVSMFLELDEKSSQFS